MAMAICGAGLALAPAHQAHAQLVIEITEGMQNAAPVAIVPFGWTGVGPAPYDVAEVVQADLLRSGQFAPIARNDMISRPTSGNDMNFQDWRLLSVEAVVVGRISPRDDGDMDIQFQVFDPFRGEQLLGYRITSPPARMRAAAHAVADRIFEALTGVPGAFSTRVAYITFERGSAGEQYRLFVADADGENARQIFESDQPIMSPAWSPEGHRLAFVSFRNNKSEVYVQTLQTGEQRAVSSRAGVNGAPAWSPDGHKLALTLSDDKGNLDVHVLNLATSELVRVTRNAAIDTEAAWSRDGRNLYFTSDRSGGPQVYKADIFGGKPKRLTFEGSYNARPRPSPDERLLALVHNDGGNYRIAVFDQNNRALQVLTNGRLDESPSFAPNGSMIIYATQENGRGVLAAVSTDGSVQQRLASIGGEVREPVWGPLPPRR